MAKLKNTYVVIKFVQKFCLKEKGIVFLQSVRNGFPGQVGQLPWSPEGRGQCDCGWAGQFRKVNTFEPLQTGRGKEPGHCTHGWIQRRKIQE